MATGFMDVRLRQPSEETPASQPELSSTIPATGGVTAISNDRLCNALIELRRTVPAELMEALKVVSPAFFGTTVLDHLHPMGYGATRADLRRGSGVGGVGDGGIGGVISLDKRKISWLLSGVLPRAYADMGSSADIKEQPERAMK